MQHLIKHNFNLSSVQKAKLYQTPYQFGHHGLGELVYFRTYSRKKEDGTQEIWPDTVTRVTEGVFSIIKNHLTNQRLPYNDNYWQEKAELFSEYMLKMRFLPPGRGLWAMGTDYVNARGSMALNNCAFCDTKDLVTSACWTMDALMCGCGVGFNTNWDGKISTIGYDAPKPAAVDYIYVIPDSREGWVESVKLLLDAYLNNDNHIKNGLKQVPMFDYSKIRPIGAAIKGFGGTASGPGPLIKLHRRIEAYLKCYQRAHATRPWKSEPIDSNIANEAICAMIAELMDVEDNYNQDLIDKVKAIPNKTYNTSRLVVDIFNAIGACVVAGNVRRSSEIALGKAADQEFRLLKDCFDQYDDQGQIKSTAHNPERSSIFWMSNNTVQLEQTTDFAQHIPKIAKQLKDNNNGEPGIFNMLNAQRYGRVGKEYDHGSDEWTREQEKDKAIGLNPCITGDTIIDTIHGSRYVKDLVNTQFHFMLRGQIYTSTKTGFWCNGVKDVYQITLDNGYKIKATSNHKFLQYQGSNDKFVDEYCNQKWTELRQLDIGDKLVLPNPDKNSKIDHVAIINTIEHIREEKVYDCSVPGANCYIANNMYSHNCGEIPLESYELCNLAETFPSRCTDVDGKFDMAIFLQAVELATIYASAVSLLPTHSELTNQIIARNHRIGVSLSGTVLLSEQLGFSGMIEVLKRGYKQVRTTNTNFMQNAGVPQSIRVTTIKPSGTVSQLAGVPPGMHYPPVSRYVIRRIRVSMSDAIAKFLIDKGIKHEKDTYSDNTWVFEFPLDQGNVRSVQDVSVWEQLEMAKMFQRWWSDNSVSVTINYDPDKEVDILEEAMASAAPYVKSLSFLPTSKHTYTQAPYESITAEEYIRRKAKISNLDWSEYVQMGQNDGQMPRYCDGDRCELGDSA